MPSDATVEDITQAYFAAWRLGVKAIAVYRDGSKRTQPLNTSKKQAVEGVASAVLADKEPMSDEEVSRVLAKLEQRHPGVLQNRKRVKLPSERNAINHRFSVGGHEGYITVGLYPDGRPGELFLTVNKEGSIVSGLMDTIAVLTSVALQYGIPLETFVRKFMYTRFEPAGPTDNPDIPTAKSLMDYVFRWMGRKFLPADAQPTGEEDSGVHKAVSVVAHGGNGNGNGHAAVKPLTKQEKMSRREQIVFENHSDAPVCIGCGSMMVRNGSCHTCSECGSSSGCS
jgi:ribonucleoside-diphosphate reductase alpha chain